LYLEFVEELRLSKTFANGARQFQQAIRQRRFAMIDMCDDGEVPDQVWWILSQVDPLLFLSYYYYHFF
jgi:hypothetical protein